MRSGASAPRSGPCRIFLTNGRLPTKSSWPPMATMARASWSRKRRWGIRDTQCGFKFFRGSVARQLFGCQRIDGYMFDVEVLYLAARNGCKIKEVGVRWRDDGDSRLQLVRGNWRNMLDLFRIRLGRY